jgi:hypothetical protein
MASGSLKLIAESPRKAVFESPAVTGPIELRVQEGPLQATGAFRSIGVNLTAPKSNLTKGEKTTLTVQVSGLQGITEPVRVEVRSAGAITLQGGNIQAIHVSPSKVSANGNYAFTRQIIGIQAGGFSIDATVASPGTTAVHVVTTK